MPKGDKNYPSIMVVNVLRRLYTACHINYSTVYLLRRLLFKMTVEEEIVTLGGQAQRHRAETELLLTVDTLFASWP